MEELEIFIPRNEIALLSTLLDPEKEEYSRHSALKWESEGAPQIRGSWPTLPLKIGHSHRHLSITSAPSVELTSGKVAIPLLDCCLEPSQEIKHQAYQLMPIRFSKFCETFERL